MFFINFLKTIYHAKSSKRNIYLNNQKTWQWYR